MIMKFKNIFTILLTLVSFTFYAQNGMLKEKKEQLKSMKVAFITSELALTSAEAEKFWPVYNAYDNRQFELRQQKMRAFQKKINDGSVNQMSDKDAASFLAQMESTEEEIFQNRKKLISNLRSVISPLKIIKLKKAEEDFNRKLLRQYRNKGRK